MTITFGLVFRDTLHIVFYTYIHIGILYIHTYWYFIHTYCIDIYTLMFDLA